ncbi:MAG: phosphate acyltransferase [Mobilicoccus sp.]|nr:phosphate acyltransferase [Mobilicoccus sp.]
MSLPIVVVPVNHGAGATTACLGLVHALDERRTSVGYVKPFGRPDERGADTAADLFRLATPLRPPQPIPFAHVEEMLAAGLEEELMEEVVALTADVRGANWVTVVEGLAPDLPHVHSTRLNVETARAIDADVLLVASAREASPARIANQVSAMARHYRVPGGSRIIGVALNHVPHAQDDGRFERALAEAGFPIVSTLTEHPEFAYPRVRDLTHRLSYEVLNDGDSTRRVASTIVAAQSLPGFLAHLHPDRLVIVPGDRHEILMSVALAETAGTRPAAVLLTGGIRPDPAVLRLCRPALQSGLPVLFTEDLTYEATQAVLGFDREIPADDEERARLVMRGSADAYDEGWLDTLPKLRRVRRVPPAAFRRFAVSEATKGDTCIAITDADDPRAVGAAIALHERGLLRCVLVGSAHRVEAIAEQAGTSTPAGLRVVDPAALDAGEVRRLEQMLHRSVGVDALLAPTDPVVVGLDLLARGEVDGLVTGLSQDPHVVVPLAEALVGHHEGSSLLSAVRVLNFPDEVVLYTDCLLHAEPSADELAEIALAGADAAEGVGISPRIALVTGRTLTPDSPVHERLTRAAQLITDRRPDIPVEAAVTLGAASRRAGTDLGGDATVYTFSDLVTADATFQAVSREPGVNGYGPLLLGLRRPVNVVGRDARAIEIYDVVIATAIQAGRS